jgi:hypothetical protein
MEWNGSKAFKGDLAIKEAKGEAGRGPKDSGQNRIGTFRRGIPHACFGGWIRGLGL